MKVAVLYRKSEEEGKEYPLDSQGRGGLKHIIRIKDALEVLEHRAELLDINLNSYEWLRKADFDLAFNLCDDGFRNESLLEAHIPAMLDILQIPYTGANFLALGTCLNKARTKEILTFHGIATPEFQVFCASNERLRKGFSFPAIVKPLHEDASIGVRKESVANNRGELKGKIDFVIKNYNQPALVERFIVGREFYVGILGHKDALTVLPISELLFNNFPTKLQFCSYEAKWMPQTQDYQSAPVQCPAKLNKGLERKLIAMAKEAYNLLECQDYGRIDFRVEQNGQAYVLEVNPNPDISEDAGLARMASASGMSYNDLIEKVVASACARNHRQPCNR